jgi:hypothetical protein
MNLASHRQQTNRKTARRDAMRNTEIHDDATEATDGKRAGQLMSSDIRPGVEFLLSHAKFDGEDMGGEVAQFAC